MMINNKKDNIQKINNTGNNVYLQIIIINNAKIILGGQTKKNYVNFIMINNMQIVVIYKTVMVMAKSNYRLKLALNV